MKYIHAMKAYDTAGDPATDFEIVGWMVLDEDRDEPVTDIYSDERLPCCGSNWSLQDTGLIAKDEIPTNKYFHGDYYGKGVIRTNV
jgi:hypothetical protein